MVGTVGCVGGEVGQEGFALGPALLHPLDRGIEVDVGAIAFALNLLTIVEKDGVGVAALILDGL